MHSSASMPAAATNLHWHLMAMSHALRKLPHGLLPHEARLDVLQATAVLIWLELVTLS